MIISFSSIKELDLSGNKVDIQLLAKLASLPNLDTLYLEDTKNFDYYSIEPDSDEYHQLQSALPNCKIRYSM